MLEEQAIRKELAAMASRRETSNFFLFVIMPLSPYKTPLHVAAGEHDTTMSEVLRLGTAKESDIRLMVAASLALRAAIPASVSDAMKMT